MGEVFSRRAVRHVLVQLGRSHSWSGVDVLATYADLDSDERWSVHELDQLLQSLVRGPRRDRVAAL